MPVRTTRWRTLQRAMGRRSTRSLPGSVRWTQFARPCSQQPTAEVKVVNMLITINELLDSLDLHEAGDQMYRLIAELYPICRSITGDGFRDTLNVLGEYIPLRVHEVATGTKV